MPDFLYPPSVSAVPIMYDRAYNVLAYGADPAGAANSTTAFSNAHDAAVSAGGYVYIPAGNYLISAIAKTTAPKWVGAGKDLVTLTMGTVSGAGPWLSFAGSIGSSVALAADAARNSITIVLVSNLTLVEGDLIIIGQDTPYTTDTNRATEYMGQQVEVLSYVSGTFTITLKEPLNETFTTAASAQVKKVTPISGCVLTGFTLNNPSPLSGTAIQCRLKWARDVAVDIRSTNSDSKCLELFSCYRGRVRMDARNAADDLAASRYGYGVSAYVATSHFLVDVLAYKVRHGFTTDSLAGDYGGPNNIVVRGLGVACTNEPFDCHHGGRGITYLGCSAIGCMGYGFQLRCASAQIIGGQVQNCAGGVRIGWRASMDAVVRSLSIHHTHRNTAGNGYSTTDGGNAIRIENNWAAAADTATGMVIENCDFEDIGCDIISLRSGTVHSPFSFRGNRVKNFGMLAIGGERAVIRPLNTVSGMRFSDNTIETSAASTALFYGNTFWGTDNYAWNNNVGANIARFQAGVEDYINYWGELTDGTLAGRTYIATFSATPVIDARRGETWQMTLTANVTSSSITNGIAGQKLRLVFVQDATGSRTVVWPATVINPPIVRSAANAVTVADLWCNGTNWYPADVLAGGSGAPTTATYIVQTADAGLSAEQALSSLATGILKNTTTTGVLTIATPDTDYAIKYVHEPPDHNILAWTYDSMAATVTLIMAAGVLHLQKILIPRDITVTNILVDVSTAGATLTANQCLASIYDNTGTKLRDTGDQATAWTSTGLKTMALTSTVAIVRATTPWVYVALLSNGTTQPTFRRAVTSLTLANMGLTAAGGYRFGTLLTGQTSMPASITIANITPNSNSYWAGLS